MKLSDLEKILLREIQQDCSPSLAQLAERCGMAQSTLWRKLQELEAAGVIRRRVALLDPARVGCKLTVLAAITLSDHAKETVEGFAKLIQDRAEITECLATAGAADYQLKVRVRDVEAYEALMREVLLRSPYVRAVQSSFVLKELKSTTELPL